MVWCSVLSGVTGKNIPPAQREDFTLYEIIAMTNFYSTGEGKSAMKKLGAYTADIIPEIQKMVMKAMSH